MELTIVNPLDACPAPRYPLAMRCKLECCSKINLGDGGYTLLFYAVYAGSEENDKYFKATPSALFTLQPLNEAAAANFEFGKQYYVDFTAAA